MKFNNKERYMFWLGILISLGAGIIGNLLVGTALDIARNGYQLINTPIFLACAIILIIIIIFITKQINKLLK